MLNLFFRRRRYAELSASIREHLEEKIADLMNTGMSREDAERCARRSFGNVTLIEENGCEVWQWPMLDGLFADTKFALRQLWKSPAFSVTAILALSLGMAAAVTIFTLVDSALLQPLPYRNPSQLVQIFESIRQAHRLSFSHDNYLDLRRANRTLQSLAAYDVRRNFILQAPSGAAQVNGASVTGDFFHTLGATTILGRTFSATQANENALTASNEVILSYSAWQTRFGGERDALGKTVMLNGASYNIIGVLSSTFQFAPMGTPEFWITLRPFAANPCEVQRGCHVMGVIARLKPGVTAEQALANAKAIADVLKHEYPGPDRDEDASIVPLNQVILGDMLSILLTLFGGAGLLVLTSYINVAALLLVRSENRRREFAVRGALGADRRRLVQQFVTEGFVIVLSAGVLGFYSALLMRHSLFKLVPSDILASMPYLTGRPSNWHVFFFCLVIILIACLLCTAVPTLRLPFSTLRPSLAQGGRGAAGTTWRLLGSRLIVLELAATLVLLVSAGLLGKSFYNLLRVDVGLNPDHVATLGVVTPQNESVLYDRHGEEPKTIALHRSLVIALAKLPGVVAVGTTNGLPIGWITTTSINFTSETNLTAGHEVGERQVSTNYFATLQAKLRQGRWFRETDNTDAPKVVIINDTLAREYFPDTNPIGSTLFYSGDSRRSMQIVGIVADIKEGALDEKNIPFIYSPFQQNPSSSFSFVIRTRQNPGFVLPQIASTVHRLDPQIAVSDGAALLQTMEDSPSAYLRRASTALVAGFAAFALLLSVIGLYGVTSYSVSQRTREIGVRMALGAQRTFVIKLILKEAGILTLSGIVTGLFGSLVLGGVLRTLLFNVPFWDASVLAAVSLLLTVAALSASFVPACRAASVDPAHALRAE